MKLTQRVLHRAAKPVEFTQTVGKLVIDRTYQNTQLANELIKFMNQANGIGLAAPQVGHSARLFVMQINNKPKAYFNPEIVGFSETSEEFDEGCLSFPAKHCIIKRPSAIQVRYQTASGNVIEENLTGLEARCYQHELDHLNGITMLDRFKEQNAT
jgi:peptide deformylase